MLLLLDMRAVLNGEECLVVESRPGQEWQSMVEAVGAVAVRKKRAHILYEFFPFLSHTCTHAHFHT